MSSMPVVGQLYNRMKRGNSWSKGLGGVEYEQASVPKTVVQRSCMAKGAVCAENGHSRGSSRESWG